jgi:hypothetical protein
MRSDAYNGKISIKTSRQRYLIELTKELRETIHAYERKLKKLSPFIDHLEDGEIKKFRTVVAQFIEPLQALEELKTAVQKRAAKSSPINTIKLQELKFLQEHFKQDENKGDV